MEARVQAKEGKEQAAEGGSEKPFANGGNRTGFKEGETCHESRGPPRQQSKPKSGERTCFHCGKQGHIAPRCPEKALYCGHGNSMHSGSYRTGFVEGKLVKDIVMDTGCTKTLLHQDLVPRGKIVQGETAVIRCAHGDCIVYPLAVVNMVVEGLEFTLEVAVSETLPVSVLLGVDVPHVAKLVRGGWKPGKGDAWMAVTRAGARRKEAEERSVEQREKESRVRPTPLYVEKVSPPVDENEADNICSGMDNDLFDGQAKQKRKMLTRSQKRELKQRYRENSTVSSGLDIPAEELASWQSTDPSLAGIKVGVSQPGGTEYFLADGLLFRRWIPKKHTVESSVDQLVLPTQCRKAVLQMAHEVPMAGHLGKHKTVSRISQRFYWPSLHKDVADFCRCCQVCQKSSRQKAVKAPLIPLPIIIEPFRRVAMDIVGPLTRTKAGNRYILVLCDYAT